MKKIFYDNLMLGVFLGSAIYHGICGNDIWAIFIVGAGLLNEIKSLEK